MFFEVVFEAVNVLFYQIRVLLGPVEVCHRHLLILVKQVYILFGFIDGFEHFLEQFIKRCHKINNKRKRIKNLHQITTFCVGTHLVFSDS